jgi:hypothetical protein
VSWNCVSEVALLASTSPSPSRAAPASTTARGPNRSLAAPQPKPATPMTRKSSVIALEMPVRDQPVSADIGAR